MYFDSNGFQWYVTWRRTDLWMARKSSRWTFSSSNGTKGGTANPQNVPVQFKSFQEDMCLHVVRKITPQTFNLDTKFFYSIWNERRNTCSKDHHSWYQFVKISSIYSALVNEDLFFQSPKCWNFGLSFFTKTSRISNVTITKHLGRQISTAGWKKCHFVSGNTSFWTMVHFPASHVRFYQEDATHHFH